MNIFARDIAKPSVDLKDPAEPGPSNTESPGGNPSADEAEPIETKNEAPSEDEGEAMQIDEAPLSQDWHNQYLD